MVQSCPTIWLFKSDVSTYNEVEDSYTDLDGVHFNFSHYSTRNDKNGFQRQFKIYKADSEQMDDRLNKLAKTPKGRQRQTAVNNNWEYFKHKAKENLESTPGKEIYAQRKIDIETVFGRMKGVFGMRRAHVRGKQEVHNDIGIMLMSMNLTKLAIEARRQAEASRSSSIKNIKCDETIRILIISLRFFYLRLVISLLITLKIKKQRFWGNSILASTSFTYR